jgi:hypothetical protein
MAEAIELHPAGETLLPMVGRREELRNLLTALRDRHSRLILGPPGVGKTRLIQEATRLAGQPCAFLQRPTVLHALLTELAEQLNCRLQRFPAFRQATSISLKPVILDSLRRAPRCVVVDGISKTEPRMYRFLQQLYYVPGACLIVTATSRESLGFLRKLLWDPREEISLEPLSRSEAQSLFEMAADRFELRSLDLDDFRGKMLAAARGNPGRIVSMCRLAGRREYQNGRHIKFLPLWIDVLSSGLL